MSSNGKSQEQMIYEIHDVSTRLETVLLGVPGTSDGGLVKEVRDIKIDVKELGQSHNKLKRTVWILIGVLAGSGVLGTGIWSILNG